MPADASYTATNACGDDMTPLYSQGYQGFLPVTNGLANTQSPGFFFFKGSKWQGHDDDFRADDMPTVLYIYRPTCGWCAKNLQNIKELAQHVQQTGGRVIGLSLETDGLEQYVQKSDMGLSQAIRTFHGFHGEILGVTPHTLVVRKGKVVEDWCGAYSGNLQTQVESVFGVHLPGFAP